MDNKVIKSWGYELIINNSQKYCGKILFFQKNKKASLHFHKIKEETWYIDGVFSITIGDKKVLAKHGDIIHIPPNTIHQVEAMEEGRIFEVSTQHFDNDTYRISND